MLTNEVSHHMILGDFFLANTFGRLLKEFQLVFVDCVSCITRIFCCQNIDMIGTIALYSSSPYLGELLVDLDSTGLA